MIGKKEFLLEWKRVLMNRKEQKEVKNLNFATKRTGPLLSIRTSINWPFSDIDTRTCTIMIEKK